MMKLIIFSVKYLFQPQNQEETDHIKFCCQLFINGLQNLDGVAKVFRPTFECLEVPALNFVMAIFGNEKLPPQPSAHVPLISFLPLMSSLKVGTLAHDKVTSSETYRLHLCYYAGCSNQSDLTIEEQKELNAIGKIIIKFLTSQFRNGTEDEVIQDCVNKSQSLYITAQHDGEIPTETIVSCINFALIPERGFYVDWLATSHEEITVEKYGPTFHCLCKGGIWVQRNLGLFLMQAANFAVYSHLSTLNPDLPSYTVALQARIDREERAQDFYVNNGFEEIDNISAMSDLDFVVFDGFQALYEAAQKSTTDYLHITFAGDGGENIVVYRNTTGIIGPGLPFGKRADSYTQQFATQHDAGYFVFPFCAKRETLLLLASGLDFFFLPFKKGVDMDGYLHPSIEYSLGCAAQVYLRNIEELKELKSWFTDANIDFYAQWYVHLFL